MENSIKVETLVGYYDEYDSNTQNARDSSEKNRDYYDGKQWTDEEVSALKI